MMRHKKQIINQEPKVFVNFLEQDFMEELLAKDLEEIRGGCGEVGTSFANFSRSSNRNSLFLKIISS